MFINSGEFKRLITFKRAVGEDDWATETTENEVCKCWAKITSIGGRQFWEAQSVGATVTHEIYLRYRDDIDSTMIITYKNKEYEILYIYDVDEDTKYLKILAKERLGHNV